MTQSIPGVEHFYAHFEVTGLPDAALHRLFNAPIALPPSAALKSITADIASQLRDHEVDFTLQWRVKAVAYEALALCLQSLPSDQLRGGVAALQSVSPVIRALRHIQDNYAAHLGNALLSDMCGMSEDHFIVRFRGCVGQTPAQYTLHYRLKMATQH